MLVVFPSLLGSVPCALLHAGAVCRYGQPRPAEPQLLWGCKMAFSGVPTSCRGFRCLQIGKPQSQAERGGGAGVGGVCSLSPGHPDNPEEEGFSFPSGE